MSEALRERLADAYSRLLRLREVTPRHHESITTVMATVREALAALQPQPSDAERERDAATGQLAQLQVALKAILYSPYASIPDELRNHGHEALLTQGPQTTAEALPHKELYFELLYAVERKHPGETRHETALRYIRETERPKDTTAAAPGSAAPRTD